MIPCFLYARKSTEAEDRQVLSIEAQIKELNEVVKRSDIKIVDILTESKSAKEPGRPIFNSMMKRLHNGEAEGILCWKLDRLARNPIDGASIIWAMKQRGLKIFTPSQTFSQENENTILMYIEFGMAQKYIDDLSKNVKRGMRMKLEKGEWPAMAPLGYLNDRLEKKIIPDPERFDLVRKMWDLMLTGCHSVESILDVANDEWGFRTRKWKRLGGRPLTKSGLYKIFTNPFYAGDLPHKQGFYKGNHKPIVTQEEFDRVQEILGRKDKSRPQKHYFSYTGGLIQCGECGFSITAEHKVNLFGSHYIYYHCTKKNRNQRCSQPSIEVNQLEKQIDQFLKQLSIPNHLTWWVLNYVKYMDKENKLLSADKKESLNQTIEDITKQINELNRMRYKSYLEDEEFLAEKAKLIQEKSRLEERLNNFEKGDNSLLTFTERLITFIQQIPDWFQDANPEQKRLIIEVAGSNLVLKDKTLLISAQIPFRILDKAVIQPLVEKVQFESLNIGLDKAKNGDASSPILTWCGRMNEVRTFWEENLAWREKFEAIWEEFGG